MSLLLILPMMTNCATGTVLNDYCTITNPREDLTIVGLRKFDCLCAENPINPNCL